MAWRVIKSTGEGNLSENLTVLTSLLMNSKMHDDCTMRMDEGSWYVLLSMV